MCTTTNGFQRLQKFTVDLQNIPGRTRFSQEQQGASCSTRRHSQTSWYNYNNQPPPPKHQGLIWIKRQTGRYFYRTQGHHCQLYTKHKAFKITSVCLRLLRHSVKTSGTQDNQRYVKTTMRHLGTPTEHWNKGYSCHAAKRTTSSNHSR